MYINVLLPKIFNNLFTYKAEKKSNLKIGDFVEVPFGKKNIELGIVWSKSQQIDQKLRIKNINKKINNFFIKKDLIKFIDWFSIYNIQSRGLILKMCIGSTKNFKIDDKLKFNKIKIKQNPYILNEQQKKAFLDLKKNSENFKVSVLQGVTGSGKTFVYFDMIKEFLKKDKQILLMLPEIFLTRQFNERFSDYFGFEPHIWHSKITLKNKRYIWQGLFNNKIKIIIGARSALLLPFKNLGLIIVDEEHDQSYKQEDGIIYNARDMAIARASFEKIPIYLVTSVPSLETFNNIKKKKYNHTNINKRFKQYPFPKTKIINLNLKKMKKEFIADETLSLVKEYLKNGNQILFFLNRRGYAPFLICKKCGFKHLCPNCSLHLVYHKMIDKVFCHHCGFKKEIINKCFEKNSNCDFSMYGPGVEKIFEELRNKLPEKKIKIFSSDYLIKKENSNILDEIKKNNVDIIVGTQMISKGYNFPNLNCIVVVDADFSGKGYDLRTTEKNIQLYNQLSGRAGRFSANSTIIYQTVTPQHETLKDLITNIPEKFLEEELISRRENNLPPFRKLIAIIISSNKKDNSFRGAQEIKKKISEIKNIEVLGPIESPIFKIKNKYRTRLLIRSKNDLFAQLPLAKILNNLKISSKIKLTVDVDPINFN